MGIERQPYVFCGTCRQPMPFPDVPFEEMLVHTAEEVSAACQETADIKKVMVCRNPSCVAPQRAIIMTRDEQAHLVPAVRSWLPLLTFRLRWSDAKRTGDPHYAVAEFAIDRIQRLSDVVFSACMNIGLLRRTLDGYGREIQGQLTVFDFLCWGTDLSDRNNWLLHPIEAFDKEDRPAPPRFNPFCALVRKHVHRLAWRRLRERLALSPCPFLSEGSPTTPLPVSRRPSCTDCEVRAALARPEPEKTVLRNCYLFIQILSEVSPCFQSDQDECAQFLAFMADRDIRDAVEEWEQCLPKGARKCWAGLRESMCPIVVHEHFVGIAMTGQLVKVPKGASAEVKQQCLNGIRDHAVPAAVKSLELSPAEQEELEKAFDVRVWETREAEERCCWLADENQVTAKIEMLKASAQSIEGAARDKYAKERRLREQYFQDELYGRLEMAREKSSRTTIDFLPEILTRMSEFWAFHDVAYVCASPRTGGKLAILSDTAHVFPEEDLTKRVEPVKFEKRVPRLGSMLIARPGEALDDKPYCNWGPTLEQVGRVLGWATIDDLVAYVTPTAFGQDLFVFHGRDLSHVSFKPHPIDPPLELLESMRQVCSGLSRRIVDWLHFNEQVHNLHVLGHTIRTPIETAWTAMDNFLAGNIGDREESARTLRGAIQDVGERVSLALEVVSTLYEKDEPAAMRLDLLDEIARIAKPCAARYRRDWTFKTASQTQWLLQMARKRLRLLLSNAIVNAFKYSYKNPPVAIAVREEVNPKNSSLVETVVTIENRGWGVLESEKPFVGNLLFRGAAVQNKPGSGLGLFLIRSIMEREGREWGFESVPADEHVDPSKGENFVNKILLRLPGRLDK